MRSHLLFVILLIAFASGCRTKGKIETPVINWTEVESIPASFGNISKGVSAAFVGLLDDKLIVAGGCNFPDSPAAAGGKKVFYKEILMYDGNGWEKTGELPYELAYGVSVNLTDALLLIGGRNNDNFSDAVYRVTMDNDSGKVRIDSLPPLPLTVDNAAGAFLDSVIYILGGNQNKLPAKEMYSLNLRNPVRWEKQSGIPSRNLIQSVMVAQNNALYVLGGYDVPNDAVDKFRKKTTRLSEVSQAVWKYSPIENKWTNISEYPSDADFSSLSGGVGAAISDNLILTLGGVNKQIFEDALNRNAILSKTTENNSDTTTERLRTEAKSYMHHPAEWYKFNPNVLIYNTAANTWHDAGKFTQAALAGASIVGNEKEIYIVNGEIKPGIRTPKIWKITWQ